MGQAQKWSNGARSDARAFNSESLIPNPKAKLCDQVRKVMRLKQYSIHTERSYWDWIRRDLRRGQASDPGDVRAVTISCQALVWQWLATHGGMRLGWPRRA